METTQTIDVTPLYGWGWVVAGERCFEVPEPFTIRLKHAEVNCWSGVVLDEGHEFEGQHVELSQRHVDWTGAVNIVVKPLSPTGRQSIGYGRLAERPSAAGSRSVTP